MVSVLKETAARYSPGATLISSTLPEIGARTRAAWRNASDRSPSSSSLRDACWRAASAPSIPSRAWAASFCALNTSFSATARTW